MWAKIFWVPKHDSRGFDVGFPWSRISERHGNIWIASYMDDSLFRWNKICAPLHWGWHLPNWRWKAWPYLEQTSFALKFGQISKTKSTCRTSDCELPVLKFRMDLWVGQVLERGRHLCLSKHLCRQKTQTADDPSLLALQIDVQNWRAETSHKNRKENK